MSHYNETQNTLQPYNRKQRYRGNVQLFTVLPVALASLFIVLLLPRCQHQPPPALVQIIDKNTSNISNSLEWQREVL